MSHVQNCPTLARSVRIGLSALLIIHGLTAQDSRASASVEAVTPLLQQLRQGAWSLETAQTVIETLISQGHGESAFWWVLSAEAAIRDKRLPAAAQPTLAGFRKRCQDFGASPEDRKRLTDLVRHLDSVASAKNHEEARTIGKIARALEIVTPDAGIARRIDAAEKAAAAGGNRDVSSLARQQKWLADKQPELNAALSRRFDRLQSEFQLAGCAVGRGVIKRALILAAPAIGEDTARLRMRKLHEAAQEIEPTRTLNLIIPMPGATRVYRDGVQCDSSRGGTTYEVKTLPGDLFQIEVEQTSDFFPGTKEHFSLSIISAQLDGKRIDDASWSLSLDDDPVALDPRLGKMQVLRITRPDDPRIKEHKYLPHICDKERGAFIVADRRGEWHACQGLSYATASEKDFTDRKLPYIWIGGCGETVVVVLKIPES